MSRVTEDGQQETSSDRQTTFGLGKAIAIATELVARGGHIYLVHRTDTWEELPPEL